MRVVPPRVQQPAERVLHRAGRRRVDVALGRRQVNDVLAEEVVGNVDAFGEDALQHAHPRLRLVRNPLHVPVLEVVEDGDLVALEDRNVVIEVFALERVGDDRLVLDADLIGEAVVRERANRALELPRRGVRAGKRKVPRDVVFEDRRLAGRERLVHAAERQQTIDVGENRVGRDAENRNPGLHLPLATCVLRPPVRRRTAERWTAAPCTGSPPGRAPGTAACRRCRWQARRTPSR